MRGCYRGLVSLGVGGLLLSGLPSVALADDPTPPPTAECDARCILARFAGLPDATPLPDTLEQIHELGYASIDFLVMLAPDPRDSNFPEAFDSYLNAAVAGIESVDFSADRFYDPWHLAVPRQEGSASSPEHSQTNVAYRQSPGALLFRRDSPVPDPLACTTARRREILMVLVIGETPTWGIQKPALENALGLIARTCKAQMCSLRQRREPLCPVPEEFVLRVLGPSSSGAAESLRTGLRSWVQSKGGGHTFRPPWRIEIISGSATARDNRRLLENDLGADVAPMRASFHATVNPDDVLWNFASDYLARLGATPADIAFLVESNTDYGQSFKGQVSGFKDMRRDAILTLPFPLHIAAARPRVEQGASPDSANNPAFPKAIRDLYLSRGTRQTYSLSTDGELTRAAKELALGNILRTIASEHKHFVCILASDPLDILFLAQQVRVWFPDVVVVVFTSDLLFLHDAVPFMDGVLVAATYPLAGWTQQCQGTARPFSRLGIGQFNPSDGALRLVFLYYRTRVLTGGQSLVALAAMLAVGFLIWIGGHLRQVRIYHRTQRLRDWKLLSPEASPVLRSLGVVEQSQEAVKQAEKVLPSRTITIAILLFYVTAGVLVFPGIQLFERTLTGGALLWLFPSLYVLIVGFLFWGCYSFLKTWRALRGLLAALTAHPIASSFRRIPPRLSEVFRHAWSHEIESVWRHHCVVLFNSAKALRAKHAPVVTSPLVPAATPPASAGAAVPTPTSTSILSLLTSPSDTLEDFMLALAPHEEALAAELYRNRPHEPPGIALKPEEFDKLESVNTVHLIRSAVSNDQQLSHRMWEEFLALRLVAIIGYVRAQIYNVIGTVSLATLPILLITTLYPFQGNRTLLMLVVSLVAAVIATTVTVFTQMNRNTLLSLIDGTKPGVVTWDRSYVSGLVLHGILPLAMLVSVKFPAAAQSIRSVAGIVTRILGS